MARFPIPKVLSSLHAHAVTKYALALELLVVGAIYFALAKLDLTLAPIHPSALPISLAPGFAFGAILLRGLRVWPVIFVAAVAAHAPSAIADATLTDWTLAFLIAASDVFEAVIAGYLINIWSDSYRALESAAGVVKFATVSVGPSAMLGATIGVGASCLIGSMGCSDFTALWVERWLRDATGLLVIAPVMVVWATHDIPAFGHDGRKNWTSGMVFLAVG